MGNVTVELGSSYTRPGMTSINFNPLDLGAALKHFALADDATVGAGTSYLATQPDRSPNALTLTPQYAGTNAPGVYPATVNGHSLWYRSVSDGYESYVTAATPAAMQFTPASHAWVTLVVQSDPGNTGSVSVQVGLFGSADAYQGYGIGVVGVAGSFYFTYRNTATINSNERVVRGSTAILPGHTYIVQASQDGSDTAAGMNLYVNGNQEAMTTLFDMAAAQNIVGPSPEFGWGVFNTQPTTFGYVADAVANITPTSSQLAAMDKYFNGLFAAH